MGPPGRALNPIHGSRREVLLCGGWVWQKYVDGAGWVIDCQVTQYDLALDDLVMMDRQAREKAAIPQAAVDYWSQATDAIIVCPECQRKLVPPTERAAAVRCPKCLATWRLMSDASAKVFHANDTHPDQALGDLNDTLGECAIPAQPGSRSVDLELVANEVFAELRRRGVVCGKDELRSYVEAANAGRFVWGIDNRTISETIEHVADRWQAAENRPEWENVG